MCDIFRMSGLQAERRAALLCIVLGGIEYWCSLLYLIVGRTTLVSSYSLTQHYTLPCESKLEAR